jgi:uncharacterized protein
MKVQAAEDAWNTCDPSCRAGIHRRHRVAESLGVRFRAPAGRRLPETHVGDGARLRATQGTVGITDDHIAVRFQYECRDANELWTRSYGNELWHFDADGYMARREASINDMAITVEERRIFGPRAKGDTSAIPIQ